MHDPEIHHHTHQSIEETLAILKYYVDHNKRHNEELHELAHSIDGDSQKLIHEACASFDAGISKLEQALALVQNMQKGEE